MKIIYTLLLTLGSVTALTSSKPRPLAVQTDPPYKVLATNDNRPAPAEKFIR